MTTQPIYPNLLGYSHFIDDRLGIIHFARTDPFFILAKVLTACPEPWILQVLRERVTYWVDDFTEYLYYAQSTTPAVEITLRAMGFKPYRRPSSPIGIGHTAITFKKASPWIHELGCGDHPMETVVQAGEAFYKDKYYSRKVHGYVHRADGIFEDARTLQSVGMPSRK